MSNQSISTDLVAFYECQTVSDAFADHSQDSDVAKRVVIDSHGIIVFFDHKAGAA